MILDVNVHFGGEDVMPHSTEDGRHHWVTIKSGTDARVNIFLRSANQAIALATILRGLDDEPTP